MIKIKHGLDLPIQGSPEQTIDSTTAPRSVALLGYDYPGLKPHMAVKVGDVVAKGQLLFSDKRIPSIRFTSPGSGFVSAINRGERRALISVVVELTNSAEEIHFKAYSETEQANLHREEIVNQLLSSGLWTAIRSRPFEKVADPETTAHSIFVTAIDSNPLAPAIAPLLTNHEADFVDGLRIIAKLTPGRVFLCKSPGTKMPPVEIDNLVVEDFSGPHPTGNVGTHIHFLDPVDLGKMVWHIGLQDVISVGKLFSTGRLYTDRILALAGPSVVKPRLVRSRLGACLTDLCCGEISKGEQRVISGSILSGHNATGPSAFLGRYHQQISVLPEDRERRFLGWLGPGFQRFSIKPIFASSFLPRTRFAFTTSTHGEVRAIFPSGNYEKVMPLDIMPLFLLKALAVKDIEEAKNLGCLELAEEDLSLCAVVCPSKQEFGPLLRRNLELIEEQYQEAP